MGLAAATPWPSLAARIGRHLDRSNQRQRIAHVDLAARTDRVQVRDVAMLLLRRTDVPVL